MTQQVTGHVKKQNIDQFVGNPSESQIRSSDRLGATFERDHFFYEEVRPDFNFVSYAGLSDAQYPIWQTLDLSDRFIVIHDAKLIDFGYYIEDETPEDDFPKSTGGPGESAPGRLKLELQHVDRFGCSLTLRGHLHGTSAEMNTDVRLKFRIRGSVVPEWLGYVGEALSEGYAFSFEGRHKQELFQYFTALDSFIEMHVSRHNAANPNHPIEARQLLADKFKLLVKNQLEAKGIALNELKFWGPLLSKFTEITKLRNAIAHNLSKTVIGQSDADECFAIVSTAIALVEMNCLTDEDVLDFYNLPLRASKW
ncbi:hypothetical protein OE766_26475 [Pararhizobium sp. YC-54]|uniref:hypothetical protein n=1 Tax=Pararhizobium sp. YC-54 TaxID=2986920 RepID=UPI0021F7DF5C|nr:hypothetical protein [Pararhizobium sp. YC-54]MCW0001765.1 hypothetical protein [Pararhizobium sp. YC-54]